MDISYARKIKFILYNKIKRELANDEDLEIIVSIIKDIEILTGEEFVDRLELIEDRNWRIRFLLMKLRVMINPADYRGYHGGQ